MNESLGSSQDEQSERGPTLQRPATRVWVDQTSQPESTCEDFAVLARTAKEQL